MKTKKRRKPSAPSKRGSLLVYLIHCRDTGLSKLGVSDCPAKRLTEVANPNMASVVHYFESSQPFEVEKALHERFAERRVECGCAEGLPTGEWFRLTEGEREMFCMVTERTDSPADLPAFLLPPSLYEQTFSALSEMTRWRAEGRLAVVGHDNPQEKV